jgi:hypothetical protein
MGQPNLILSYLVTLLICCSNKKYLTTILSFLIIIKANYIITFLAFLKNHIQIITKSAATILFISLILFPLIKPSFYSYYVQYKNQNFTPVTTISDSLNYYNQSLPARLSTLGLKNATIPFYISIAVIILFTVYRTQNIILAILASIILSPTSWQHYFVTIIPIYFVAFAKTKMVIYKALLVAIFFLIWVEFPTLHYLNTNTFTSILSSHYLISSIILFWIIYKNRINTPPASK